MSFNSSPIIPSTEQAHLLAWWLAGKEPDHGDTEQRSYYTMRMMGSACMYSMVEATTHAYGLHVAHGMPSEAQVLRPNGGATYYREITLLPEGRARNTDHTTAEMRESLASGWQFAMSHFANTASGLSISRADTPAITGQLIIPRPDDAAIPAITDYLQSAAATPQTERHLRLIHSRTRAE